MILIQNHSYQCISFKWIERFIVSSLKNCKQKTFEYPYFLLSCIISNYKWRFSGTEREEESDFKVFQRLICI